MVKGIWIVCVLILSSCSGLDKSFKESLKSNVERDTNPPVVSMNTNQILTSEYDYIDWIPIKSFESPEIKLHKYEPDAVSKKEFSNNNKTLIFSPVRSRINQNFTFLKPKTKGKKSDGIIFVQPKIFFSQEKTIINQPFYAQGDKVKMVGMAAVVDGFKKWVTGGPKKIVLPEDYYLNDIEKIASDFSSQLGYNVTLEPLPVEISSLMLNGISEQGNLIKLYLNNPSSTGVIIEQTYSNNFFLIETPLIPVHLASSLLYASLNFLQIEPELANRLIHPQLKYKAEFEIGYLIKQLARQFKKTKDPLSYKFSFEEVIPVIHTVLSEEIKNCQFTSYSFLHSKIIENLLSTLFEPNNTAVLNFRLKNELTNDVATIKFNWYEFSDHLDNLGLENKPFAARNQKIISDFSLLRPDLQRANDATGMSSITIRPGTYMQISLNAATEYRKDLIVPERKKFSSHHKIDEVALSAICEEWSEPKCPQKEQIQHCLEWKTECAQKEDQYETQCREEKIIREKRRYGFFGPIDKYIDTETKCDLIKVGERCLNYKTSCLNEVPGCKIALVRECQKFQQFTAVETFTNSDCWLYSNESPFIDPEQSHVQKPIMNVQLSETSLWEQIKVKLTKVNLKTGEETFIECPLIAFYEGEKRDKNKIKLQIKIQNTATCTILNEGDNFLNTVLHMSFVNRVKRTHTYLCGEETIKTVQKLDNVGSSDSKKITRTYICGSEQSTEPIFRQQDIVFDFFGTITQSTETLQSEFGVKSKE
jgi:hypothetical protein